MKILIRRTSGTPVDPSKKIQNEYNEAYRIKDFFPKFKAISELNAKYEDKTKVLLDVESVDIVALVNKYGELIVGLPREYQKIPHDLYVEIYDDYRE